MLPSRANIRHSITLGVALHVLRITNWSTKITKATQSLLPIGSSTPILFPFDPTLYRHTVRAATSDSARIFALSYRYPNKTHQINPAVLPYRQCLDYR